MIRIEGEAVASIRPFFEEAAQVATEATCLRAKCGSAIVALDGRVIGRGYNAPPLGDESQRACTINFDLTRRPKYDKTCCVHAEWNAVLDGCGSAPDRMAGATLYFMRIDEAGNFTDAGDPYCTTCSRLVMQARVAHFALWNNNGADIYPLDEYNRLSYDYHQ